MDDEGLSPREVAGRLGVAVTTLRTWHQRYDLGPTRHVPGRHRRYGPDDLARLEVMRRLTVLGVPAAEAARVARQEPATALREPATALREPGGAPGEPGGVRAGGGHAIPVGRAKPEARGLAAAAMRLDAASARWLIEQAVTGRGVVRTWDELVRPVLTGVGDRHAATARLVEVEHLLSRCVSEVFGAVPRPGRGSTPRTLLACADEEQHSLPIEALAAALAERGVGCRLLGARVPPAALHDAVRRTAPATVLLWSHAPQTADPAQLRALLAGRRRPVVVAAAGPGWGPDLPEGVARPASLGEAVELVASASG